jgi:hypothetical protein
MNPKRSPWIARAALLVVTSTHWLGCTQKDASRIQPDSPAQSDETDPVLASANPARSRDGELPSEPELLPLICPDCGVSGGGDTTDFDGNARRPCQEVVSLISADEARSRGLYPDSSLSSLDGQWDVPIGWRGTSRRTRLRLDLERTGRLEVTERSPWPDTGPFMRIDAGPEGCTPSFREELRASFAAADGSIAGRLEAVASFGSSGTHQSVSLRGRGVEVRGNLDVQIDRERQPFDLEVSLRLYDLAPAHGDRVSLSLFVSYREGEPRSAYIAGAGPADGCLVDQLPWEDDCVQLWRHPEYRQPLPEAGTEIEPTELDSGIPTPPSDPRDAGLPNGEADADAAALGAGSQ